MVKSVTEVTQRLDVDVDVDLILYVPSTIFHLNRDGSSWVEPLLSCFMRGGGEIIAPTSERPFKRRTYDTMALH